MTEQPTSTKISSSEQLTTNNEQATSTPSYEQAASTSSTTEPIPTNTDPLANMPEFLKRGTIGMILKPGSSLSPKFIRILFVAFIALISCLAFMYYVPGIEKYHSVVMFIITVALSTTLFYVIPTLRQLNDEEKQELRKKLILRKKRKILEERERKQKELEEKQTQDSTEAQQDIKTEEDSSSGKEKVE